MSFHAKDIRKAVDDYNKRFFAYMRKNPRKFKRVFGINKKTPLTIVKEETVRKDIYSGGLNL